MTEKHYQHELDPYLDGVDEEITQNDRIKSEIEDQEKKTTLLVDEYVSKKWYRGPFSSEKDVRGRLKSLKEIQRRALDSKDDEIKKLQDALKGDEVKKVSMTLPAMRDNLKRDFILKKNIADGIIRALPIYTPIPGRLPEGNPLLYGKIVNAIHELQSLYNHELRDKNITIRKLRKELKEKNEERRESIKRNKKERKEALKNQKEDKKTEAKLKKLDQQRYDLIMKNLRKKKSRQEPNAYATNDNAKGWEEPTENDPTSMAA